MTAAVHLRLDRKADAVAIARDAAFAFRSTLTPERLDDLRLVLSELVTNAISHGEGPTIDVRLTGDGPVVRGEVVDQGDGFDLERCTRDPADPANLADENGRGLYLMRSLMDSVERYSDGGNVVRLTLRR